MELYGIIGHPLGHTMSPTLHNWGFRHFGLDARYEAWPTPPESLPAFFERFRRENIRGLSVTIPHKRAVMPLADRLTPRALAVGAVNTLYFEGDDLVGENTDVVGVTAPLQALGIVFERAVVLGAGGAARAAVAALKELEIREVRIANRTREKAVIIARDLGAEVVDWDDRLASDPDLVLNATPLGMSGDFRDRSPVDASALSPSATVFDLVYNPLQTRLLTEATARGCRVVRGVEMFLHQGLEQFRLWTGRRLPPEAARQVVLDALSG